jgi:hypothetical protein
MESRMNLRDHYARAATFERFLEQAQAHAQLWRTLSARAAVPEEMVERARALGAPRRLLVLLEDWCGDAINTVPYLAALAEAVPGLELRVLRRDEHPEVMDAHLSPTGGRSIPVVIVLDADGEELGWWGSRPAELQRWATSPEARAMDAADRYRVVRTWYARDRGRTTVREVLDLLEASLPTAAVA